jgi:hypothetical protein
VDFSFGNSKRAGAENTKWIVSAGSAQGSKKQDKNQLDEMG